MSVVIAARNEAASIGARLDNLASLDYPLEKVEVIVASDGSTDATAEIAAAPSELSTKVLALPRRGKGPSLNDAVAQAGGDILVFTDANSVFTKQALRELVRPFADPEVGGVAGNQVYVKASKPSLTADGERLYWSFDRMVKQSLSRAGSVTSATGAIYAVRRALFTPIPADAMDDFVVSTGVVAQGFRLVFAPAAIAIEPVATSSKNEFSRKVRIITQGLRAVIHARALLDPRRYGFYSFQLFTHKVLRRLMVFPLLALLALTPWLLSAGPLYRAFAIAQLGFYAAAGLGWFLVSTRWVGFKILGLPSYVCMVNVAVLVAVARILTGRSITGWDPERHAEEASGT